MLTQSQLNKIANYGSNNIKRWTVSIDKCYQTNDRRD